LLAARRLLRDPPGLNTGFCRWSQRAPRSILSRETGHRVHSASAARVCHISISENEAMKPSTNFANLAVVVSLASLAWVGAAQAVECNVKGNRAVFGVSMNAGFDIKSGRACTSGYAAGGLVQDAKVTQQPQHGSVRLLNNSSFDYRAQPGYTGADAFVIEATGSDTRGSGTSVVTYNINVR
jgi:hypothetical protein